LRKEITQRVVAKKTLKTGSKVLNDKNLLKALSKVLMNLKQKFNMKKIDWKKNGGQVEKG
jgi:hypothetical protein